MIGLTAVTTKRQSPPGRGGARLLSGLLGLQLARSLTYLLPCLAFHFPARYPLPSSVSWDAALRLQQWWYIPSRIQDGGDRQ